MMAAVSIRTSSAGATGSRTPTARALELGGWCTVLPASPTGTVVEWHVTKIHEERP